MTTWSADGLNPIERNGCNDIFEIRQAYPDKLLFGNVCCIHTLPHGTLGDVEDETLELIEKIGPQGGLFIGSSSEVHDAVPVENAAKMYGTVHEYGAYPIDVDRIATRRTELRKRGELKSAGRLAAQPFCQSIRFDRIPLCGPRNWRETIEYWS